MRDACIRRLAALDDWQTNAEGNAFMRFERLLRCIEDALAPSLAASRDKQEAASEQRVKDVRFAAECAAEAKADARKAAIDADPRVQSVLDAHQILWAQAESADVAVQRIEARLHDPAVDWMEKVPLRQQLTAARSKATRLTNKAASAWQEVSSLRNQIEKELRRA